MTIESEGSQMSQSSWQEDFLADFGNFNQHFFDNQDLRRVREIAKETLMRDEGPSPRSSPISISTSSSSPSPTIIATREILSKERVKRPRPKETEGSNKRERRTESANPEVIQKRLAELKDPQARELLALLPIGKVTGTLIKQTVCLFKIEGWEDDNNKQAAIEELATLPAERRAEQLKATVSFLLCPHSDATSLLDCFCQLIKSSDQEMAEYKQLYKTYNGSAAFFTDLVLGLPLMRQIAKLRPLLDIDDSHPFICWVTFLSDQMGEVTYNDLLLKIFNPLPNKLRTHLANWIGSTTPQNGRESLMLLNTIFDRETPQQRNRLFNLIKHLPDALYASRLTELKSDELEQLEGMFTDVPPDICSKILLPLLEVPQSERAALFTCLAAPQYWGEGFAEALFELRRIAAVKRNLIIQVVIKIARQMQGELVFHKLVRNLALFKLEQLQELDNDLPLFLSLLNQLKTPEDSLPFFYRIKREEREEVISSLVKLGQSLKIKSCDSLLKAFVRSSDIKRLVTRADDLLKSIDPTRGLKKNFTYPGELLQILASQPIDREWNIPLQLHGEDICDSQICGFFIKSSLFSNPSAALGSDMQNRCYIWGYEEIRKRTAPERAAIQDYLAGEPRHLKRKTFLCLLAVCSPIDWNNAPLMSQLASFFNRIDWDGSFHTHDLELINPLRGFSAEYKNFLFLHLQGKLEESSSTDFFFLIKAYSLVVETLGQGMAAALSTRFEHYSDLSKKLFMRDLERLPKPLRAPFLHIAPDLFSAQQQLYGWLNEFIHPREGDQRGHLLRAIIGFPQQQIPRLINLARTHTPPATPLSQKIEMAWTLAAIDPSEREVVANRATQFMMKEVSLEISSREYAIAWTNLAKSLAAVSQDEWEPLLQRSLTFLGRFPIVCQSQVFYLLSLKKEASILALERLLASSISPIQPENQYRLLLISQFFSLKSFETILGIYTSSISEIPSTTEALLTFLLRREPELIKELHSHLGQSLESETQVKKIMMTAELIKRLYPYINLYEQHPLVQTALIKRAHLQGDKTKPKHPCNVNNKLKQMALLPAPTIELSVETINNRRYRVNPQVFLSEMERHTREKPKITFSHFPLPPNFESIKELFNSIEARLDGSPRGLLLKEKLENDFEESFQTMKEDFTKHDFLESMANLRGNPDEEVPVSYPHFFGVMKYIEDQPHLLGPETLLTAREDTLLKISISIFACQKADGLLMAYNLLPLNYRCAALDKKEIAVAEQGRWYLYRAMQSTLNNIFVGENQMNKDFVGAEKTVEQLAHQTVYLNNALALRVGKEHQYKIDTESHHLYDELLVHDLPALLQGFYNYALPSIFVRGLQDCVIKDRDRNGNIYGQLNAFLVTNSPELLWKLDEESIDEEALDEESIEHYSLNQKGSLDMLLKVGYIEEMPEIIVSAPVADS